MVTSINIQNTTLTANLILSNLSYNLSGTVPGVVVPEPGTFAHGRTGSAGFHRLRHSA